MKARDRFSLRNKELKTVEFENGIEIVNDNDECLYTIILDDDGSLEVSAGIVLNHNGKILNDRLTILPRAANVIAIERPEYK